MQHIFTSEVGLILITKKGSVCVDWKLNYSNGTLIGFDAFKFEKNSQSQKSHKSALIFFVTFCGMPSTSVYCVPRNERRKKKRRELCVCVWPDYQRDKDCSKSYSSRSYCELD